MTSVEHLSALAENLTETIRATIVENGSNIETRIEMLEDEQCVEQVERVDNESEKETNKNGQKESEQKQNQEVAENTPQNRDQEKKEPDKEQHKEELDKVTKKKDHKLNSKEKLKERKSEKRKVHRHSGEEEEVEEEIAEEVQSEDSETGISLSGDEGLSSEEEGKEEINQELLRLALEDDKDEDVESPLSDMSLLREVMGDRNQRKPPSRRSSAASSNASSYSRKNMSFSNTEVKKIDRENEILLKKILKTKSVCSDRKSKPSDVPAKVAPSSIQRRRKQKQIDYENLILLRKIQTVKSSVASAPKATSSSTQRTITRSRRSPSPITKSGKPLQ